MYPQQVPAKTRDLKMGHAAGEEKGKLNANNELFGDHLLWLLCGKPGQGKSWLLAELLLNPKLLNKVFEHVFFFTPSQLDGIDMRPGDNWFPEFDIAQVMECVRWCDSKGASRVLFIFDDVIGSVKEKQNSKDLMKFIFNRRHLLKNGIINIILTTQKYIVCPPAIRSCLTGIVFFRPMVKDWRHIKDEYIFSSNPMLPKIIENHFNGGEHNFVYVKINSPYKIILNFETDL